MDAELPRNLSTHLEAILNVKPAKRPKHMNVTLDILRWFKDNGLDLSPSRLRRRAPPGVATTPHGFVGFEHVRLGATVSMSQTPALSAAGSNLIRWLKAAPSAPTVTCATSHVTAYVEVGDLVVYVDGTVDKEPMDKRTWTTTIFGEGQDLLAAEEWIRSYPKMKEQRAKPQVHFITQKMDGSISTTSTEIKRTTLAKDAPALYGEDILPFHDKVLAKLKKDRNGIVLLHGPPGGGKTTYVRHLTSCLMGKKRVIMVPKSSMEVLSTPRFTEFLIGLRETPSVLVLEDAEEVVAASNRAGGPATSTLLNLTDGIVNDVAGVQVILTFNCPVSKVDPAILRSGRLIGMREFGPLSATHARALAASRGLDTSRITGPTMLCDVLASAPVGVTTTNHAPVGFR
jgi:hypothetical protein